MDDETRVRPKTVVPVGVLVRWLTEPQLALWPDHLTIDELMRQAAANIEAQQAAGREMAIVHGDLLDRLRTAEAERDELRKKLTRPLEPDSHDADWWRRASSFWAGQDETHERDLRAAEARVAEAEKILLGGLGKSWNRVVDDAIRALRGAGQ
jgi:hypothetical protein